MIKIKVTTFGALGSLTISQPIFCQVKLGTKLPELIEQIKKEILKNFPDFNQFEALEKAAIANESEILKESYIFDRDTDLAILPPICGG